MQEAVSQQNLEEESNRYLARFTRKRKNGTRQIYTEEQIGVISRFIEIPAGNQLEQLTSRRRPRAISVVDSFCRVRCLTRRQTDCFAAAVLCKAKYGRIIQHIAADMIGISQQAFSARFLRGLQRLQHTRGATDPAVVRLFNSEIARKKRMIKRNGITRFNGRKRGRKEK
jgi:hypothetical protein